MSMGIWISSPPPQNYNLYSAETPLTTITENNSIFWNIVPIITLYCEKGQNIAYNVEKKWAEKLLDEGEIISWISEIQKIITAEMSIASIKWMNIAVYDTMHQLMFIYMLQSRNYISLPTSMK